MMRNPLSAATWKRLTFAVILSTASLAGLVGPASEGRALPLSPSCSVNQSVITTWYRDAARTQAWCQDITSPCPGSSATHYCDGSQTPYFKKTCGPCSLN